MTDARKMRSIGVTEITYGRMEMWRARVERQMRLAPQSWDQFLSLMANSGAKP